MHGAAFLLIALTQFPFGNAEAYAGSIIAMLLSGLVASSHVANSGSNAQPDRRSRQSERRPRTPKKSS